MGKLKELADKMILKSSGLKRRIVAALAFLIELIREIPELQAAVAVLEQVNGVIGGTAVTHATVKKTLSDEKIAGAVSVVYFLILVSSFVPALLPIKPVLLKIAGILSAIRLGSTVGGNT